MSRITIEEARKYLGQEMSDERVEEIIGYLYGLVENVIQQEFDNNVGK